MLTVQRRSTVTLAFLALFQCVGAASVAWLCGVHPLLFLGVSALTQNSRCPTDTKFLSLSVFLCEHADVTEFCRAHLLSAECRSVLHAGLGHSVSVCIRLKSLGHRPARCRSCKHRRCKHIGCCERSVCSALSHCPRHSPVVRTLYVLATCRIIMSEQTLPMLSFTFFSLMVP